MAKKAIGKEDLLPIEDYIKSRKELKAAMAEMKRNRRIEVGPYATFYFENFDTMRHQIQEMLYIERGGDEQLKDELAAYNPLVPQGNELVATVMFEIDDPEKRHRVLSKLGGVEETMAITVDGAKIGGVWERDVDRTNAAGKASSVQFVHFPMSPEQVEKFRTPGTQVQVGIHHPNYGHIALMPEPVREALSADLD